MIVPYVPDLHVKFVLDAWRRSSKHNSLNFGVSVERWNVGYGNLIIELLKSNTTLVAVDDEDPDNFVGFASHHGKCLDYVYIKNKLRKFGFGKELYDAAGCDRVSSRVDRAPSWLKSTDLDPYDLIIRNQRKNP